MVGTFKTLKLYKKRLSIGSLFCVIILNINNHFATTVYLWAKIWLVFVRILLDYHSNVCGCSVFGRNQFSVFTFQSHS